MTKLYEVVAGGGETIGTFSSLDKAKAAVEARVIRRLRAGDYGREFTQSPVLESAWEDQGDGTHTYQFSIGTSRWYSAGRDIYTIELDPAELP